MKGEVTMENLSEKEMMLDVMKNGISGCKEVLTSVINSDDESNNEYYEILKKEVENNTERGTKFNDLAKQVLVDCGKVLDNPNLPPEAYNQVLNREIEVLKITKEHDKDNREFEKEIEDKANKKDTEKRTFHWNLIKGISSALIGVAMIALEKEGDKLNIELPKLPKDLFD